MIIKANSETYFVFDLDDTLYSEIDFLKSAFNYIANRIQPGKSLYHKMFNIYKSGGNTFEYIIKKYPDEISSIDEILDLYRNHVPDIPLKKGVKELFVKIKSSNGKIGVITNGRSITQRNKIKSLGLTEYIDKLIISEEIGFTKPNESVYKYYLENYPDFQYYYFGDNPSHDFLIPKKLGWCCIGIVDKNIIHKYNISEFSKEYLPHIFIKGYTEIVII